MRIYFFLCSFFLPVQNLQEESSFRHTTWDLPAKVRVGGGGVRDGKDNFQVRQFKPPNTRLLPPPSNTILPASNPIFHPPRFRPSLRGQTKKELKNTRTFRQTSAVRLNPQNIRNPPNRLNNGLSLSGPQNNIPSAVNNNGNIPSGVQNNGIPSGFQTNDVPSGIPDNSIPFSGINNNNNGNILPALQNNGNIPSGGQNIGSSISGVQNNGNTLSGGQNNGLSQSGIQNSIIAPSGVQNKDISLSGVQDNGNILSFVPNTNSIPPLSSISDNQVQSSSEIPEPIVVEVPGATIVPFSPNTFTNPSEEFVFEDGPGQPCFLRENLVQCRIFLCRMVRQMISTVSTCYA
ncbi:putative uncharacterized protein DDB_G0286901 [Eurytemora carolleeae]|uniref:putative uncharacterized protein DDB_G0286901 n=1 Tax=Eurytemora carolleeae TaxID=1294199 RepID=UPI000C78C298|nr:putative uncharacterized protein DDB_G0286901 [Eurytemora carolleeae]|eukprot:XP_023342548.1 putative uncharacterized protein DDB_G0286901 [Eurytemora affinis]